MNFSKRRIEIFSPIFAVASIVSSFFASINASASLTSFLRTYSATPATNSLYWSPFATKSVSQLTSTNTAVLPSTFAETIPSAAILEDFLAAVAIPFSLNRSIAFSISPLVSVSAFLQSNTPAPVF